MRFINIKLEDLELDLENNGNFYIPATDELVEIVDKIRKRQGYTDLVFGPVEENDVYYNFYLTFDAINQEINIEAICHNGQEDDYESYYIPLFPEEEKMLNNKDYKDKMIEAIYNGILLYFGNNKI